MMRPHCHNRPAFVAGRWVQQPPAPNRKPRWRWSPRRMSTDCGAWKVPPGSTPHPVLSGWDCSGCRWIPPLAALWSKSA